MVIPEWKKIGGFMYFRNLDALSVAKGVLAVAYRFTDGNDDWTCRLNEFKAGQGQALRGAKTVLARGLRRVSLPREPIALCVAISSGESRARKGSHLYELGKHIAEKRGWEWCPALLEKSRHRPLHSLPTAAERDAELVGKYRSRTERDAELFVVLDDFCTRGTTIYRAAEAIQAANGKRPVFGLVLGKTERLLYAKQWGETLDNSHVPKEWRELWDNA